VIDDITDEQQQRLEEWDALLALDTPKLARLALAGNQDARRVLAMPPGERSFEFTGDWQGDPIRTLRVEWERRMARRRVLRQWRRRGATP